MCGICSSRRTSTVQDCSPLCPRDRICRRRRTCCIRRLAATRAMARPGHRAVQSRAAAEGARSRAAHGSGRNVVHADHEVAGIFQSQATAIGSCRHRVPPLARRLRGEGSASRWRRDNSIEHDEGAATVAGHALSGARTRTSPVRRSRCRRTAGRPADVSCLLSNRARI